VPDVSADHQTGASPESDYSLRTDTTLRLGAPVGMLTGVSETDEGVATVRNATEAREPWFIRAGGGHGTGPERRTGPDRSVFYSGNQRASTFGGSQPGSDVCDWRH
jgi:hypothetical protein